MSTADEALTVAVGEWTYDADVSLQVRVIALNYDYWFALAEADGRVEADEERQSLGPEGLLYYASFQGVDSSGYPTIMQAKAAAQTRLTVPIRWA